jgi:hypothetical protein
MDYDNVLTFRNGSCSSEHIFLMSGMVLEED